MNDIELIHGLADGSLEKEHVAEAQRKVETDSNLRAHYDDILRLRQATQADCKGEMCPETWKKCQGRLAEMDRNRTVELFTGRYAWQMAACLFFLIVGVGFYNRAAGNRSLHMADLAGVSNQLSAASISPESILGNLFSKKAEARTTDQVHILRGLHGVIEGREVSQLDLEDSRGRLQLTAIAGQVQVDGTWEGSQPGYRFGQIGEANCITWYHRGNTIIMLGDRSHEELIETVNRNQTQ